MTGYSLRMGSEISLCGNSSASDSVPQNRNRTRSGGTQYSKMTHWVPLEVPRRPIPGTESDAKSKTHFELGWRSAHSVKDWLQKGICAVAALLCTSLAARRGGPAKSTERPIFNNYSQVTRFVVTTFCSTD